MRERTKARSLARHAIQLRPPTAGCSIVNQAGLRTCEGVERGAPTPARSAFPCSTAEHSGYRSTLTYRCGCSTGLEPASRFTATNRVATPEIRRKQTTNTGEASTSSIDTPEWRS